MLAFLVVSWASLPFKTRMFRINRPVLAQLLHETDLSATMAFNGLWALLGWRPSRPSLLETKKNQGQKGLTVRTCRILWTPPAGLQLIHAVSQNGSRRHLTFQTKAISVIY